jgi:hypothetical protein
MKAICEGTSNRRDVVNRNIAEYRDVFVRTMQQMNVIKQVRVLVYAGYCHGYANRNVGCSYVCA